MRVRRIRQVATRVLLGATVLGLMVGLPVIAHRASQGGSDLVLQPASAVAAPISADQSLTAPPVAQPRGPARADDHWVSVVARRTGISAAAVAAYAATDLRLTAEQPSCALSWATLAGVGWVESQHGTLGGRELGPDGRPGPTPVLGLVLTGAGELGRVIDSDGGRLDGDTRFDRALGPMQLLPATWLRWRSDGDGDGRVDPNDIDDASYAAGRYLCASGGRLDDAAAWTRAVLSYNPSGEYVQAVLIATNTYASRASG